MLIENKFDKYFEDLDEYFKENPELLIEAFLEADKLGPIPLEDVKEQIK